MDGRSRARWTLAALAAAGLVIAASGGRAQMVSDVNKEVMTAATHAGLAAGSKELPQVQMHLHHVVNCLVGPKGKGFDAAPGNPCKDQGNGAISDMKIDGKKKLLRQALARANAGLQTKDLEAAQKDATQVEKILKTVAM